MSRRYLSLLFVLTLFIVSPPPLRAGPVHYFFEGKLSGTFTGSDEGAFSDQPFVLTLSGDTDSIRRVGDRMFEIPVTGTLHVETQGTAIVTEDLHLWSDFGPKPVNFGSPGVPSIGLSIYSFDSGGIIVDQPNAAFDGFALDRTFGPVDLPGPYAITGLPSTEIGVLNPYLSQDVTFRALVTDPPTQPMGIPLPPALWVGLAMLALLYFAASLRAWSIASTVCSPL